LENPLTPLVAQLSKLPGVGPKSAQRLAFFFLSMPPSEVTEFSETLVKTRTSIRYCSRCFNLAFSELCFVCENPARQPHQLCVVAEPKDIFALERTQVYKGLYHVLGGVLSPIDGIHPEVLRIPELIKRLRTEPITELVLAINPTIEGDATVLYLTHILQEFPVSKSKLAYGLPVGSDMDYADEMTLRKSVLGRTPL
jgi:recombination protein RecR